MKYPVSDIFTYSPFLPHDYLCSEENDAGMDTGGGATDTASNDGGVVDDGSFDLGSNPDAIGTNTSMSFDAAAQTVGAAVAAAGIAMDSPVASVSGIAIGAAPSVIDTVQSLADFINSTGQTPASTVQDYGTVSQGFAIGGDPGNGDSGGFVVTSYDTFGAGSG